MPPLTARTLGWFCSPERFPVTWKPIAKSGIVAHSAALIVGAAFATLEHCLRRSIMGIPVIERLKSSKDLLVVSLSLISGAAVALNAVGDLSGLVFRYTGLILFLFWCFSLYLTFPSSSAARGMMRYAASVLVTVIYAAVAVWFIWETRLRHVDDRPGMRGPYSHMYLFNNPLISHAEAATTSPFKIEEFVLLKDETTFIQKDDADFSNKGKMRDRIDSYIMDPRWFNRGPQEACMDGYYDKFADAMDGDILTMDAFTYYLKKSKKEKLYPYLENIIINKRHRADIEAQLYPSSDELNAMRQDASEPKGRKYAAAISNWIKYCVGIPYPVFRFVVSNQDKSQMLQLTSIDYVVEDIGGYGAIEPGLFQPVPGYVFPIEYKAGLQVNPVTDPILKVPPGQTASFNLTIFNDSDRLGLTWKLKVRLRSNLGDAETSKFQLFMSGRKTWKLATFK
jgi:hypothetical protein